MNNSVKDKIKSVVDDYNDIASDYCREFGDNSTYNCYIDRWLKGLENGEILDAGCGCANNCQYINSHKGFKSIGIDFSDNMLLESKKQYPNCEVIKMDMTNLLFEDDRFTGILSNCSLFHIPQELIINTLKGFKRVLKNNGGLLLVLLEGNGEEMLEEPYRVNQDVYVYTKYYTIEEIIDLLHSVGFSVDNIEIRTTESNSELGGKELIVYSKNKILSENEKFVEKEKLLKK